MKLLFSIFMFATSYMCAQECCTTLPSRFSTSASPQGMVWIAGGEFTMGTDSTVEAKADERLAHKVRVSGLWMHSTPVTNRQFQAFEESTGYVTTAEKVPTMEEIMAQVAPGTPPPSQDLLVAASLVFKPAAEPVSLHNHRIWW